MTFIGNIAVAGMFVAAAVSFSSCSKVAVTPDDGGVTPDAEVLGTYEFDGDTYDILTAVFEESESLLSFVFSPLEYEEGVSLTTYLSFSVDPYWADGEAHNVNDPAGEGLDHQDDYFLVYNDPVHYYSQYREPESGWFRVTRTGSSCKLEMDIRLADGTPLKISYDGKYLNKNL